jgi:hypothetical protein
VNDRDILALLRDLSADGCPVCIRMHEAGTRFVRALARKLVNDPATRAELRASLGFCREHATDLAQEVGAPLAVSLIHADLCGHVASALRHGRAPRATRPCPACDVAAHRERHDLAVAAGHMSAVGADHPRPIPVRSLPVGPAATGGELPIGSIVRLAGTDPALAAAQARAYDRLKARLEALVRHHDYRFHIEAFADHGSAWEALSVFSGTDAGHRPRRS